MQEEADRYTNSLAIKASLGARGGSLSVLSDTLHAPVQSIRGGSLTVLSDTLRASVQNIRVTAELMIQAAASAPRGGPSPAPPPLEPAFRWAPGEGERLALLPIRHDDLWSYRKTLEALHWNAQEIDLTKDRNDWQSTRMADDERNFVKMQLAFFARIDIDVLDNLDENFGQEVDCLEARFYYAAQRDQECVHTESYSLQIEAVMEGAEREQVFNAVRTMPIIGKMRAWVKRWFDRAHPAGDRLVAWAGVEGVLFSSSFNGLQWLRERNLLPGITDANTMIVRDEGIHTLFTCLLVRKYLIARPSQERVEEIFGSLVELLDEFVRESLPVRLIGLNAELMTQYVRFQADCVIADMGYKPVYGVAANPCPYMDKLTLNEVAKVNFFEHRPNQYQNVTSTRSVLLRIDTTPVDDDEDKSDEGGR